MTNETSHKNLENILVIKLGALGDFVQALGPMKAIRDHHPNAHITLMTTSPFEEFGQDCGYFDHVWVQNRMRWHHFGAWRALRKILKDSQFDRVYDLQNNDRTAFYFRMFPRHNKPQWVGTAVGASHRNISPARTAGSAFAGHVQTLGLAGIENVEIDKLSWMRGSIASFRLPAPFVLLIPGSAPSRLEKRWPAAFYGTLANKLYDNGYTPVIVGSRSDHDLGVTIHSVCNHAINLSGRTTLKDLVLLARSARGAIGNDTGPMHMIAPTGCPALVLFSRHSRPSRHAPQGANVSICQQDDLKDLTAETVWQETEKLLGTPNIIPAS
jgi:ADP-heptose:LPS heptosyltransferase